MLPPLSTDISLPGLPTIAAALHATPGQMAATLSAFIIAFGFGQLAAGPLSDHLGRRPVLIGGLIVFALAGLACTVATNANLLIFERFVQGLGACCGTVVARAVVQDVTVGDRARATSVQALLAAVNSLAPIVAPLLGAVIVAFLPWRSLYGVLVVIGVALVAVVARMLPETAPGTTRNALQAYARVIRQPRVAPLALVLGAGFGAYFTLISGSPFALEHQMHVSSSIFAVCFVINAASLLCGATLTARLAGRIGPERLFGYAIAWAVSAALLGVIVDVIAPTAAGFAWSFALYGFAMGIVIPSAYAAGLARAGGDAGAASAVLGATQFFGGGITSAIAGSLPLAPAANIGSTVLVATMIGAGFYLLSRRGGEPAAAVA
jgi:DHA1 family bicyclomycin/chloramphenicol resistance-like MFS transporter